MFSQAVLFDVRVTSCKSVFIAIILAYSLRLMASTPGDFTVVVLPDPQNYSQYYPQIFDAQTRWIAANAAAQNIQVVLEVGDSVNNAKTLTEWQNANHSISLLDQASVPYAIAIGNHDYDTLPRTNRQATYFNQYFGPSRYSGKPYYGPSSFPSGGNENFYETFTWGGKPYLILVLEFVPRSSAVAWAKSVLSANADKEVIVVTHSYLFSDSTTVDQCDTADMVGDDNGAMLWSDLISQYPNVSVVVSGHITNKFTARRSYVGVNGNFVHQIFANWQDWTSGGNGYLRIMQFSLSTNTIQVKTYSPYLNSYLTDATNQFTVKWHNDGAPGRGTAKVSGRVRSSAYGSGLERAAGGARRF
jgi:calcineurin-like phosphoesterase family protein